MENQLQTAQASPPATMQTNQVLTPKAYFSQEGVKKKFEELLGKRATGFITSVLQIVASNDLLKGAEPQSIFQAAATAATLDLPLNNNLGFAYIVPYKTNSTDNQGNRVSKTVAQFQMGYKGFIQLFQRSGQGKSIYATPVYEGQIVDENPLDGYTFDFTKKTSNVVTGYACRIKLINGFEATLYLTKDKIEAHGKRFSQTYKKGFGLWKDDFESMALKTVTKALLSKYAPLSVDMQTAVTVDQAIIKDAETMDVEYIDHTPVTHIEAGENEQERRVTEFIATAKDAKQLEEIQNLPLTDDQAHLLELKKAELSHV